MSDEDRPPDDQEPTRLSDSELPDAGAQHGEVSAMKRLGDFELIREIGRGGMGVVYEARQVSLKRRVALKVLPPVIGLTRQARQRFEREAQAAAKLHHTNIVPVHAIGEEDGHHFYAMDLIEGQSLDRVLHEMVDEGSNALLAETVTRAASELPTKLAAPSETKAATTSAGDATTSLGETSAGSRPWFDTVAQLISEVADALDYAHGRGVIHRDIKPANLMLSREGRLCITDFGLARIAQGPGMTVSDSFLGTPAYMSPEQIAAGRVKLDHRTDVYSLGAVLYELLTLQRPFVGESREEVLSAIMAKDPRSPRKLNGKIPQDLETICLKAMEKDPDRRYDTAGELAQDLRQYMHGGLITARRAGPLRRFGKSVRRHPVVATIVVAAVLLAGIGSLTVRLGRQKETADALRAVAETRNLIHAGRYSDALRQAHAAYREHPQMAELRLLRGYALIQLGRLREAVGQARRRLESDPDDWVAHTTLLHAALKGDFLDSEKLNVPIEEHLRAVETLAPESAHVYFLRALSAELDAAESFSLLNKALELDPGHADALVVRINMFVHQGNFEAALLDCERLTVVRPRSSQGRRLTAYVYRRQLELESALATINQAVDLEPEMPSNYHQRAAVYQLMGRTEEAFEDRTRTVEMASRIGWHYQNRSWLHETLGRGGDADSRA